MAKKKRKPAPKPPLKNTFADAFRQCLFPPELRIVAPLLSSDVEVVLPFAPAVPSAPSAPPGPPPSHATDRLIAEVATCLWYLKTKHFKRDWASEDGADDDPRVRRALGRLNRGLDALKAHDVEIQDPTNKRYQPGSEGTMRPIQFDPTPGLDHQRVAETVVPIIYLKGRIIQRGEVFVAVPVEGPPPASEPPASGPPAEAQAAVPAGEAAGPPAAPPGPASSPAAAEGGSPAAESSAPDAAPPATGDAPDSSHRPKRRR